MDVDRRPLDRVVEHAYERRSSFEKLLVKMRAEGYRLRLMTPEPGRTAIVSEPGEMCRTGPVFICVFERY